MSFSNRRPDRLQPGDQIPLLPLTMLPPLKDDPRTLAAAILDFLGGVPKGRCWRKGPMGIKVYVDCPPGVAPRRIDGAEDLP